MINTNKVILESNVKFGTSGARGLVTQFSVNVCAAFASAFVCTMTKKFDFKSVAVAIDNRPSSYKMAQGVIASIENLGLDVIYYGVIPTPALAYSAIKNNIPSIMITGSHIPFDRNGIKFYRPDGEITKADEKEILTANVLIHPISKLPKPFVNPKAAKQYIDRYTSLFDVGFLAGKKIGIYEHSSAGRDLYPSLFEALGAEVVSLERTNEFVPIDTEAVAESDKEKARAWSKEYNLDFIFSTDGDGDRPLVADENGEWLRGDILGLLCAEAMNIEALAIPVSCNTIIEQSFKFKTVFKTKIGSPYVIAEFNELTKKYSTVAGFEANGGFLLGSDVDINGRNLQALPTRDAVLPALMLLYAAQDLSIVELQNRLPKRFTHSDRIKKFETINSLTILENGRYNPQDLVHELGFDDVYVVSVDTTDGLRLVLSSDLIIHLRPSGNAPELRCYVEANTFEAAKRAVDQILSRVQKL